MAGAGGLVNETYVREAIRQNWHLLLAFVAVAVMGVIAAIRQPVETVTVEAVGADQGTATAAELETPFKAGGTRNQDALLSIQAYKQELAKDRQSEEAAKNFRRIGNLYYSQLGDWEQAMEFYEALITQFPNWEGLDTVYPNLAECYRKLGQHEMERQTYKRMMEYYPEETQAYLFAQQQLGL